MAQAYVLINCEMGAEESVMEQLKHIDYVKEVHGTFGAYDVVAKLVAEKTESIRQAITWQARKIARVRSTLTLMGVE